MCTSNIIYVTHYISATEVNMYRQLSLAGQGYICCTGVIVGKSQTSKYTQVEFRYCMLETNFCNLNSIFFFPDYLFLNLVI